MQKDLTNKVFGKLTAQWPAGFIHHTVAWLCLCTCGKLCVLGIGRLTNGHTKSCGCAKHQGKHGLSRKGKTTPEYRLWITARRRAKVKNLPFNIDVNDIIIPSICPLLGNKLFRNHKRGNPNAPSLDKLIPRLGYVKENVWVISLRANIAKSNLSIEEMRQLLHNWESKVNEEFDL